MGKSASYFIGGILIGALVATCCFSVEWFFMHKSGVAFQFPPQSRLFGGPLMGTIALILVLVFVLLLVMNVPIAVSIAMASLVAILAEGFDPSILLASKMVNGVNSFALMVITYVPFTSLWLPVQTKQLKKTEVEKAHFMKDASSASYDENQDVAREKTL